MDKNCMYCDDKEKRDKMLLHVTNLSVSRVYLNRDQSFDGRCVVVFKEHKKELYELTNKEIEAYFNEVAITAKAITEIFKFDKMNYAIFGDKIPHLHMHLAGKYTSDLDFGVPYNMCKRDAKILSDEEYSKLINIISQKLII